MPPLRRLSLALAVGCLAGVGCALSLARPGYHSDFAYPYTAARLLLAGSNPYGIMAEGLPQPLWYPLPAVLALLPLARLPLPMAGGLFMAASCGALAWVTSADPDRQLALLVSPPMIFAVTLGQWAPLLLLVALVPGLQWMGALKPNLGLAHWTHRPTWFGAAGALAVLGGSLLLMPTWPLEWRAALARMPGHPPPMLTMWGGAAILALLRWRRPEARLLVALACVPQAAMWYDQLALWLVPRSARESLVLTGTSALSLLAAAVTYRPETLWAEHAIPYALAGTYWPALVMVLRRPNEGTVPGGAWLANRLPAWVTGGMPAAND